MSDKSDLAQEKADAKAQAATDKITDLKGLNDKINEFQKHKGNLSANDHAFLDAIQSISNRLVEESEK